MYPLGFGFAVFEHDVLGAISLRAAQVLKHFRFFWSFAVFDRAQPKPRSSHQQF